MYIHASVFVSFENSTTRPIFNKRESDNFFFGAGSQIFWVWDENIFRGEVAKYFGVGWQNKIRGWVGKKLGGRNGGYFLWCNG